MDDSTIEVAVQTAIVSKHGNPEREKQSKSKAVEDRKARKRELDRISQRRKRQKDRETMERLKRSLEQPHDPTLLHSLVLKQEQDLARIQRHGERMIQIQALLQADLADLEEDQTRQQQNSLSPPSDDSFDAYYPAIPEIQLQEQNCMASLQPAIDLDGLNWDDMGVSHINEHDLASHFNDGTSQNSVEPLLTPVTEELQSSKNTLFMPSQNHVNPLISLQSQSNAANQVLSRVNLPDTDCGRTCHKCESQWRAANGSITLAQRIDQSSEDMHIYGHTESDIDAHIMITAIAEGWSVAETSPFWNERWNLIRQIDQKCHSTCANMERLVVMFNVNRKLKSLPRISRAREAHSIPQFLHERPSQMSVPHAVVIDYFVWPGFREHIIFNHQRYCNNNFSQIYASSLKFLWPYELRDTYLRNRETKLYQFSRTFLDQADDLRCYTLDASFFTRYPEFRGDVPIFDSLPRICPSIKPSNGGLWHYFPTPTRAKKILDRGRGQEDIERAIDYIPKGSN